MIRRNLHPGAYWFRFPFALAMVGDGLVRLLSLGHLCTDWPVTVSRNHARSAILRAKRQAGL